MKNFKRKTINLKKWCNNEYAKIDLFILDSGHIGPHVYIQSSLHGAELQGSAVIYSLMEYFFQHEFNGKITFVPQCNPLSVNNKSGTYTKGRFHPVTGVNFNRQFFSLAYFEKQNIFSLANFVSTNLNSSEEDIKVNFKDELKKSFKTISKNSLNYGISDHDHLALTLQSLSLECDIVLDLHTASMGTNHLYIADFLKESAKAFMFPFNIIIPNKFLGAFDESNFSMWYALKEEFSKQGREIINQFEAFTLELGNEEQIEFGKASVDRDRILSYLNSKKMLYKFNPIIEGDSFSSNLSNFKSYYSPTGGVVDYVMSPGEFAKEGDLMAKILSFSPLNNMNSLNDCITEIRAINDCAIITRVSSSNISEGTEIFQVLENLSKY